MASKKNQLTKACALILILNVILAGCDKSIYHEITVSFNDNPSTKVVMFASENCAGKLYHPIKIKTYYDNNLKNEYTHLIFSVSENKNLLLQEKLELSLCINHKSDWMKIWMDTPGINNQHIAVSCDASIKLGYDCASKII